MHLGMNRELVVNTRAKGEGAGQGADLDLARGAGTGVERGGAVAVRVLRQGLEVDVGRLEGDLVRLEHAASALVGGARRGRCGVVRDPGRQSD